MSFVKKTPLQIALDRNEKGSHSYYPCENCEKFTQVDNVLYCGESGKIILPDYPPNWSHKCSGVDKQKVSK